MDAWVLAAGKGERLWPLSTLLPKCLWPVGGKPCVRWIVDRLLASREFELVHVCCLLKDQPLYEHEFRDLDGVLLNASDEPLGTAGQIPLDLIEGKRYLTWWGDHLVDVDVGELMAAFRREDPDALLVLSDRSRSQYGQVETHGDRVVRFEEKPVMGHTWVGVGVFGPKAVAYLGKGFDYGRDVVPEMIREGRDVRAFFVGEHYDIGNVGLYSLANEAAAKEGFFG